MVILIEVLIWSDNLSQKWQNENFRIRTGETDCMHLSVGLIVHHRTYQALF